jgi:hypothetical protein
LRSLGAGTSASSDKPYGGMRSHIAGNRDGTLIPFLAETWMISSGARPKVSSICSAIRAGSAFGRSILLRTGIIGRFLSWARKKFATYRISELVGDGIQSAPECLERRQQLAKHR